MASITERAQRMEKDLRETSAKHDRTAAELQVNVHEERRGIRVVKHPVDEGILFSLSLQYFFI